MAPKRKKSKPNPEAENEQAAQQTSDPAKKQDDITTPKVPSIDTTQQSTTGASSKPSPAPSKKSSWYGSWRSSSKASPVAAQLAKENISVAQGATSEASETAKAPNSVSKSVRGSRKSIPLAAEPTRVHATSDVSDKSRPRFPSEEKLGSVDETKVVVEEAQLPPEPAGTTDENTDAAAKARPSSWFGWWSRPDGYGSDGEKRSKKVKVEVEQASSTPLPGTPIEEPGESTATKNAKDFEGVGGTAETSKEDAKLQPEMNSNQRSSRSWFGLWSSSQNQQAAAEEQATKAAAKDDPSDDAKDAPPEVVVSPEPKAVEEAVKDVDSSNTDGKRETKERSKSSGWAFWSTDKSKEPPSTPGGTQKQVGELAVADTPSQSHPEVAQFNEQRDELKQQGLKPEPKRAGSLLKSSKKGKAEKVKETPADSTAKTPADTSGAPTPTMTEVPSPSQTPPPQPLDASSILSRLPDQQKASTKQERQNHVLPSFQSTFSIAPNPGYVERLTSYLAQSLHLPGTEPPSHPQHVFRSHSPPKIKKAVALGIHGFFPGALIQKFIGQPRGTSVRLANYAATAIKNWCAEHQPDGKEAEIEKVALEGEGYIADRVTTLWKLLLNWLSHLRQADFILVACHSQGVPVAIMLVAKLIQLGCLSPNVRLGICAMAGINLGPFLEYRSRLFGGTALELFEFCDSNSAVSRAYAESLELCLRHGIRVTFVGSIDDQLVSLESSLHMPLHHPYVNRAVFIDGRLHAPNFLTHLVVFALKLRNLGVSDHGLIRELSGPLAGSLVGGEGHSRVYDDPSVYNLAIEFALESTDAVPSPTSPTPETPAKDQRHRRSKTLPTTPSLASHLQPTTTLRQDSSFLPPGKPAIAPVISSYEPPPSSANTNPYYLPWAVRGMLEEDLVKREMWEEVVELVREFEEWKPSSKVLRDVRFRLEGVRGMV